MATTARKKMIVSVPTMEMDIFKTIAKKFNWKISNNDSQTLKKVTGFQKSQEDIRTGKINTYKNSDELFEKIF